MRIQHNIMSMNAYRNYNNNASALSKNLEKLSSGYKINRAGDDAAGLAISEKMRAQIKGLEAAQKNVKDGISLVKTAEGAMQEIQDMLSRMKYLATQSSNGTYDDEVDRKALQDEVDQLNSEINRIADSANFNGTKLLDGSLGSNPTAAGATPSFNANLQVTPQDALKGKFETTMAAGGTVTDGDKVTVSVTMEDASGNKQVIDINFTVGAASDGTAKKGLVAEDGTVYDLTAAGTADDAKLAAAAAAEMNKRSELTGNFTITENTKKITFENKETGAGGAKITGIEVSNNNTGKDVGVAMKVDEVVKGVDKFYSTDLSAATPWDGKDDTLTDSIITIGGKKFAFINPTVANATNLEKLKKAGVDHYVEVATKDTVVAADVKKLVEKMKLEGLDVVQGELGTGTPPEWTKDDTKTEIAIMGGSVGGGGLQLQIGDTSDSFNQLMVTVGDLHADAIGVGSVDISSITGATNAIDSIKEAINTVSAIRGKLGATQNRLEHTANNLSVMTENIQDAESTIRDTDVADEMMAYTKNNILIQSAQAMLAQANSVPQGVLQLLQ